MNNGMKELIAKQLHIQSRNQWTEITNKQLKLAAKIQKFKIKTQGNQVNNCEAEVICWENKEKK